MMLVVNGTPNSRSAEFGLRTEDDQLNEQEIKNMC